MNLVKYRYIQINALQRLVKTSKQYAMNPPPIYALDKSVDEFQWHRDVIEIIAQKPDDRRIVFIVNPKDVLDKKKLVGKLEDENLATCIQSSGKAKQLQSSVLKQGAARSYFIDLLSTPVTYDAAQKLYHALKSIKVGFVKNVRGCGKAKGLMMEPPNVVVFTNEVPDTSFLSADRWTIYYLKDANSSLHLVMDGTQCKDPETMEMLTNAKEENNANRIKRRRRE